MSFPISTKLFSGLNPARHLPQRSDTPLVQRVKRCALAMIPIAAFGAGSYFVMNRTGISHDATEDFPPGVSTSSEGQAEDFVRDLGSWVVEYVAIGIVLRIVQKVFLHPSWRFIAQQVQKDLLEGGQVDWRVRSIAILMDLSSEKLILQKSEGSQTDLSFMPSSNEEALFLSSLNPTAPVSAAPASGSFSR